MRVRCISYFLTEEQIEKLGKERIWDSLRFTVKKGKEYLVYGLHTVDGAPWILYIEDPDFCYLSESPLCLFEIVDGRASRYWECRMEDGDIFLWPPSFNRPGYFDDLDEEVPEIVDDFNKVRGLIEIEFLDMSTICPACGYDLGFVPGDPAFGEICPSCGTKLLTLSEQKEENKS